VGRAVGSGRCVSARSSVVRVVVTIAAVSDAALAGWPLMEAVPSDAELTAAVADILGSENLESLTVRTMMGILGRRFEGVDLTQRKKFIKHEVDRLMHLRVPAPADEGELGDEGGGYEQQQQHLQAAYPPAGVPATCTFPLWVRSVWWGGDVPRPRQPYGGVLAIFPIGLKLAVTWVGCYVVMGAFMATVGFVPWRRCVSRIVSVMCMRLWLAVDLNQRCSVGGLGRGRDGSDCVVAYTAVVMEVDGDAY